MSCTESAQPATAAKPEVVTATKPDAANTASEPGNFPTSTIIHKYFLHKLHRAQLLRVFAIDFMAHPTDVLRLRCCYAMMKPSATFTVQSAELRHAKSKEWAELSRHKANELFAMRGPFILAALHQYNAGLAFIPLANDTDALPLVLHHRSTVYEHLRLPAPALADSRMAMIMHGFNGELMAPLMRRVVNCERMWDEWIEDGKEWELDTKRVPTLGEGDEHRAVKFCVASLTVRRPTKVPWTAASAPPPPFDPVDRHVITRKRLQPGDVVSVELPFISHLDPLLRHQRCWHCLAEAELCLLPCRGCTIAMWCSQLCRDTANLEYHAYECGIIDYLVQMFDVEQLLALRCVLVGVAAWGGSVSALGGWLRVHGGCGVDAFEVPASDVQNHHPAFSPAKSPYWSDLQRQFHLAWSLESNRKRRVFSDLFERSTAVTMQFEVLKRHVFGGKCRLVVPVIDYRMKGKDGLPTKTPPIVDDDDELDEKTKQILEKAAQNTLIELLMHFNPVCSTNAMRLMPAPLGQLQEENEPYGLGLYSFGALLNHSCAPNVVAVAVEGRNVLMALRTIEKGEQLFVSYGPHHCTQSRIVRRHVLRTKYHFDCQCIACREDYPQYVNLDKVDIPTFDGLDDVELDEMQSDTALAEVCFDDCCQYLSTFDRHYPCAQLVQAQTLLQASYSGLQRATPLAQRIKFLAPDDEYPAEIFEMKIADDDTLEICNIRGKKTDCIE